MRIGQNLIPLGIVDDRFDLELYFDNNTMFIKEDLQMNFPANLSASDCPDGYVPVPGNTLYGTSSFCVMKYEAKVDVDDGDTGLETPSCDTGNEDYSAITSTVKSTAEDTPLVNVNLCAAKQLCENSQAHLITNEEWMTIARNIERQPENWTGGQVGSGVIKRGNVAEYESCEGCYNPSLEIDFGTDRNELAKLVLSNGSKIWDFSGNVEEWNDTIIQRQYQPQPSGSKDWFEGEITDYGIKGRKAYTPLNLDYNIDHGIGYMYSSYISGDSLERAVLRGGGWYHGSNAGPFAVYLSNTPGYRDSDFGFRCSVVPS
jgi:formylglycine-generating enzyme required for sulfatase activity